MHASRSIFCLSVFSVLTHPSVVVFGLPEWEGGNIGFVAVPPPLMGPEPSFEADSFFKLKKLVKESKPRGNSFYFFEQMLTDLNFFPS